MLNILWIARNAPEKGVAELLKIANNVKNVVIHAVGLNPVNVENIITYKNIPIEELNQLYKKCDLFLYTSIWPEPAGLTLLEAQLNNLQIIGLKNGAVKEYTKNAILFETTEQIIEYLKNLKLQIESVNTRKFVEEKFSYKRMGRDYEKLYEKLVYGF